MPLSFCAVELPGEMDAVVRFLCAHDWPLHSKTRLHPTDVLEMVFDGPDVASFWIADGHERIGLVRLLDLRDVGDGGDGCPLFDLRLASTERGRGVGQESVRWLTSRLFETHPLLHRVEANTRFDNIAMRRVLERCGYRAEGQLRETWMSGDGTRHDTMVYGILRREWSALPREL